MAQVNIVLDEFEGPFDLLFHLIEKNEMDIYDIPMAELTEQYMAYIDNISNRDMDGMSEFLLMAATLLEIKSRMLLPKIVHGEEDDADPREQLIEMLVEYKRFKQAAETFRLKENFARLVTFKQQEDAIVDLFKPDKTPDFDELLSGVTMNGLLALFNDILRRQELKTDKVRSGFSSIKREIFTVEEKIEYIENLLTVHKLIVFSKIFHPGADRAEKIITFWAVLEMIKNRTITIAQKNNFDDIFIKRYKENI